MESCGRVMMAEAKVHEAEMALHDMWLTEPDEVRNDLLKKLQEAEDERIQCKYTHFSAFPCRFA
jgi:hypothetical protein